MKTLNVWGMRLICTAFVVFGMPVNAQIVGSQHDLTVGGSAQASTAQTDQVCVFCHTPHGATNSPALSTQLHKVLRLRFTPSECQMTDWR